MAMKRDFSARLFTLCFFTFVIINIATIQDGHNWGDDFSQYILHARNIIEGREYTRDIMLDNPVVFPPGFPLFLVPWMKGFGLNFKVLKTFNVMFWYLHILLLYPIFLKRVGREMAAICSLVLMTSSYFFLFKQNILSDVPFLFFTTLAIYVFTKYCDDEKCDANGRRHFWGGYLFWCSGLFCLLDTFRRG